MIQLQQADNVFSAAKRNEGDGFIALSVAAITGDSFQVLRGFVQESGGAVGPESAALRKKGLRGICLSGDYCPAHTFQSHIAFFMPVNNIYGEDNFIDFNAHRL